jgi:hypothetical protein
MVSTLLTNWRARSRAAARKPNPFRAVGRERPVRLSLEGPNVKTGEAGDDVCSRT